MMRQTLIVTCASLLLVSAGFALFYLMKIQPVQEELSFTRQNIRSYQELSASKQKNKKQAAVTNLESLPGTPEAEKFFVSLQKLAVNRNVTVLSITRTGSSGKTKLPSGLQSDSYTVTLQSDGLPNINAFIGDLESMKKALTIDQFSVRTVSKKSQAAISLRLYYAR
ncbi:hypothetical protein EWI07_14370 [Sporolactobacillus sp. THM7-4]|nr:hypothetical protein EWI07_14370 [Sporolactobacillus sp. THM7-4]